MEDMRKMAREAFAFYPSEIVDVFINKRGSDAQVRLLRHPEGLTERRESRRRLEALVPVIEAVEKGYTFPRTSPDDDDVDSRAPVLRIKAIADLRGNVLRIIQGLDDSIAESEASERLAEARAAVADFKFDPGIIILRHRAGIEKDATIVKRWGLIYDALYNRWRAILGEFTYVTAKAGGEVSEALTKHMDEIWRKFAENKPPEATHDSEYGGRSLDSLDMGGETAAARTRLAGLEQELAVSTARAKGLGEEQPDKNAELESWTTHIKSMEVLYEEVTKYVVQELVGRSVVSKETLGNFKGSMQKHLEARTRLQTRKCAFAEYFKEEYDQKKRDQEHVARTTLKPPLKDFDGSQTMYLGWLRNQLAYNNEINSTRKGDVLKKTIKNERLLKSLVGVDGFDEIIKELEKVYGNLNAQAPYVIEELRGLRNYPDRKGELDNIDTILGNRRLLQKLEDGQTMFNSLFINTLQHKLTRRRCDEWLDMVVRNPIEERDKVDHFIAFMETIRMSHHLARNTAMMLAHPEGTEDKSPKGGKHNDEKTNGGNKRPKVPSTNTNVAKTGGRKCELCSSKNHGTPWCTEVERADSTDKLRKIHEKMSKLKICLRCVKVREEDEKAHVEKCVGGRWDCKECSKRAHSKGINSAVCFCKIKKGTNANRIGTTTVNTLRTNGCSTGGTLSAVERVTAVRRDGSLMSALIQYDTGAQSSCISEVLVANSAIRSTKGSVTINTIGGEASPDGQAHTIRLKDAGGKEVQIDGLGVRGRRLNQYRMRVQVPAQWKGRLRREHYAAPGGGIDLLLGLDAMKYHPEYVDETPDKDIQLYQSRLTGRLMLVGNPESAGIVDKPKNGTSTGANRITVDAQTGVRSPKEAGGGLVAKRAGGDLRAKRAGGDLITKEVGGDLITKKKPRRRTPPKRAKLTSIRSPKEKIGEHTLPKGVKNEDSGRNPDSGVRFDRKDERLMKHLSLEGMELEAARRCSACKGCNRCKASAREKSAQDELEEQLQRATIGQKEIGRNYHGDYVWIRENLKLLHPNRNGALRDFEGLEGRLHRRGQGLTETYNQGIGEGFAQGAYRWV